MSGATPEQVRQPEDQRANQDRVGPRESQTTLLTDVAFIER